MVEAAPRRGPEPANPALPDRPRAVDLLRRLVAIPSLSGHEAEASRFLAEQMASLGYERAFVDAAGNAVGELGSPQARSVVVLLGHIDTVAGGIPVRIETVAGTERLFGRGSVDAKGPLTTFTLAGARLGAEWAHRSGLRLIVVGAVEEEAATSRGARFIRDRFDGADEPIPLACIIGEPSRWDRLTLGYKGRLLIDLEAQRPTAHTAGQDPGIGTIAVEFWNCIQAWADRFNAPRDKLFDQVQPSLRHLGTEDGDGLRDRVSARAGIRLPLEIDRRQLIEEIVTWGARRTGCQAASLPDELPRESRFRMEGETTSMTLRFWGHEAAWRSGSRNLLVRSFLEAMRHAGARPRFVVKTGTSDLNVVAPAWRCPSLAYGPGDSNLDHTPNEHLDLQEYWQAILVLERALRNLGHTVTADATASQ